jgi:hypothetical protein
MQARALFTLALCFALYAAKKPQPLQDGAASDNNVSIKATVYNDPLNVKELLGDDLGGHYIVIKIDLTPNAKKYSIDHDDFLLRTDKDGERAKPYEPTQIAGDGALVITTTDDVAAEKKKGNNITLGGMGGGMGSSPGMVGSAKPLSATMKESTGKTDPVLKTLEERILPQREVEQATSGLLYFPMEKQKVKDLELIVTTPSGKLHIRFSK